MIKPDMIPDDVVEAAREAWLRSDVSAKEDWRVAIAAALRAWPGVGLSTHVDEGRRIVLPLPKPLKMDRKAAVAERLFGDDQA